MLDAIARMAFTEDARTGSVLLWSDTLASLTRMALGIAVAALAGLGWARLRRLSDAAGDPVAPDGGPLDDPAAGDPAHPVHRLRTRRTLQGHAHRHRHHAGAGARPGAAAREIPAELLVKAQTLGANSWTAVLRVILPQLLARLLLSLRLMLGAAWLFLISSEAISATAGLGYRIFLVRRYMSMDVILPYVAWITPGLGDGLGVAPDPPQVLPGPRGARHEFHRDSQRLAALAATRSCSNS